MESHSRDLLLVIDMQNIYTSGQQWACLDTGGVAERVNRIIASGKCAEVIFTRFLATEQPTGVWADYNQKYEQINHDRWANEMVPQLEVPLQKYPLYTKSVYSSLAIPEVAAAAKRADRVIVTGVVAECCVLSTVFALMDAGSYVVYLTDGVSGLDREKEAAAELTLSGLSPLQVSLMTTAEYLAE
ncbi:MAG: cysteine hydrolase [Muribaculaceae bacterium]|nr:cysteine hydrolase [Roseburia sp.]MCM1431023.1 cysteine hydrolase [Muribaculaceae bacterium]MCM1493283.1 cysteine hydrolase [Muribaculaceae bacterium]